MAVFATGLITSERSLPLHGRIVAVPRDLEPRAGAYELFCGDEGAAVVFVVYHQGEPLDLTSFAVELLADGIEGSPFALEQAPSATPSADAKKGEVRWVVPGAVTAEPCTFRAQLVVRQAGACDRASNVLHFRVRPRVEGE